MTVKTSALPSAIKLTPELAAKLQAFSQRRQIIEATLEASIQAAIKTATEMSIEAEQEHRDDWASMLAELQVADDKGWTADVNDVNDAYLVRFDELQNALVADQAAEQALAKADGARAGAVPVGSDPSTPS